MKTISTLLIFGALSVTAMAFPTLKLTGIGKGQNVKISLDGGDHFRSVFAGEMKLRFENGPQLHNFIGMCTDADLNVASGQWGVDVSTTTALNPNGGRIGNLVNTYMPGLSNNDQARALQLVIWELSEETSGSFNLTTGNFLAKETNNDVLASATLSAANTYLANLGQGTSLFYRAEVSNGQQVSQNMVAPVPEPASLAAIGFGALGLLARRRRARR